MRKILLFGVSVLVGLIVLGQGKTTSSMNGTIRSVDGETLIGATVKAVHTPSGTVYGNVTNLEGIYRIPNMRVGGPYEVTISYVGYKDFVKSNVYLRLGQAMRVSADLSEASTQLDEIVVTASGLIDGNQTGQQTIIDEELMNGTPTISRSIGDFARLNPLAKISETDDGFQISIAGQNNRYNSIYIDGAVNNDVFGLAGGGTNGGQTGVQPVSIDAIEQFQVAVAPFDVRQSGFAGGAINAVTRSGTNDLEGSAYYFFRNENLAGKTPTDLEETERTKLADFSAKTYGFRLGGPIIKDKLFFFANGELQRDETPQPFDFNTYEGDATEAEINELADFIQNMYNYDVGSFDNNTATLNSEKFLMKLDWNISDVHKLSARHSYVKAENLEARSSGTNGIGFINGSEYFVSTTNSSALELNSLFGDNLSNRLLLGATIVRDDRDPFGNPFPNVSIQDGDGTITLGAETFSTANLVDQDVFTLTNDLEMYKGRHTFLVGVNVEYFNVGNLFIRDNFGQYVWEDDDDTGTTGLESFMAGEASDDYDRSYSQVDNVTGDDSDAIAAFKQLQAGAYIQDEYQVNDQLKITAGVRLDVPFWITDQPVNEDFNENVLPLLSQVHDLKGARTGSFIQSKPLLSPRVGFNYDLTGDESSQLRGGIGIFTSRIPLVWPGGAYNNYGLNIGSQEGLAGIAFVADVDNQPVQVDLDNITASGQIDLFAEDFKLPQVLKFNLAWDKNFGQDYILTLEGLFSKNIQAVRYENLNLNNPVDRLDGSPDNRPIYNADNLIASEYTGIYLASNTSKGYTYNLASTISKNFEIGLQTMLSYSWGDAYSAFEGTSSQNSSQWAGYQPALDINGYSGGRNGIGYAQRSTFSQGHRVLGQFTFTKDYLNFGRTSLSLNVEGRTGGYFSYVYDANNDDFVNDNGFNNVELIYVPRDISEINLIDITDGDDNVLYSAEEQWDILDAFISDNKELENSRGDYAGRNIGVLPFQFNADFRILQDFYINMPNGKRNTFQFSLDIFNLTNFLNKDWGRVRNFSSYQIINLENSLFSDGTLDTNVPQYTVDDNVLNGEDPWENNIDDSGFRSSRWQMQIGLRYIFGG